MLRGKATTTTTRAESGGEALAEFEAEVQAGVGAEGLTINSSNVV